MKTKIKKILLSFLTVLIVIVFSSFIYNKSSKEKNIIDDLTDINSSSTFSNDFFKTDIGLEKFAEEIVQFSEINTIIESNMLASYPNNQARDIAIATEINNLVTTSGSNNKKRVGISTARDLYDFSTAASYSYKNEPSFDTYPYVNMIQMILSLDYVLLSDIDYSTIRGSKFIPIGIDISIKESETNTIVYNYPFTGTFDGQGFTISNLYVADSKNIKMVHRFLDEPPLDVDFPTASYYSMFTTISESAKISNLVIENPIFELLDAPEGLNKVAYLVGKNKGIIYNVGVIDRRVNTSGIDISGIRFNVQFQGGGKTSYEAAGFVHTNDTTGKIYNSFFLSKNIVSTSSKFRFSVKPFYYSNGGIISGVAYDKAADLASDDITQINVNKYTLGEFESGKINGTQDKININDTNISELTSRKWTFYVNDGYPKLFGLEYDDINNRFKIKDEYDLLTFTKLLSFKTLYNNIPYNRHNYYLENNIDMKNISNYKTPNTVFEGTISGGDVDFTRTSTTNSNKYIINLKIQNHVIINNEYYLGFLGIIGNNGTVKNINFDNNEVIVLDSELHYGKKFYVGTVSAKIQGGTIKNVISNTKVDLNNSAIGSTYVGGLVGYGYGNIRNVANLGTIDGNVHNFNNHTIDAKFNIGGIIGGSSDENLVIHDAINKGNIFGIGSNINYNLQTNANVNVSVGGIIGEVNNGTIRGNSIYYVTNTGTITARPFAGATNKKVYQNVGGIFGNVIGNGFKLVEDNNLTVRNGRFENEGIISVTYESLHSTYYTAGIGVASTTQKLADFSYMINKSGYNFTGYNFTNHNINIFYAATIIDNSSGGVRLSRAYNENNYSFGSEFFIDSTSVTLVKIAPFFTSITNNDSELLYVENKGNLLIGETSKDIIIKPEIRVSGITQSYKVNYRNVYNSGKIYLLRLNQDKEIYASGIAWVLPYNTSENKPYTAENVVNEGEIITADIKGSTLINSYNGTNNDSFNSNITNRNVYVAGLFNLNVGEISNSFNRGEITSTYNSSIKDIDGTANTYVGGIVTFNYNKIIDTANTANIIYENSNNSAVTRVANINYGSKYGGLIITFNGGLTLGGIAAAFGDTLALILSDYGRNASINALIQDTSNKGNIYGKANAYVRSAGILAVALGVELTSGTDNNVETGSNKKFSYSVAGAGDRIGNATLSNGLNFGNITAVTNEIGKYNGSVNNAGESGTSANSERPGINAAAGGIIAYGLTKMVRMLNHGVVASTDVAGGIVGATYILGGTSSNIAVTKVEINTAVHYGRIKAIKQDKFTIVNYDIIEDAYSGTDINSILYLDNDTTFIFPVSNYNLSVYPNKKRGFGGIFGRLQRGSYGRMESDQFVNIMNMDENIDMVGRVDQSSYGSLIYFLFKRRNVNDTYYTARKNDTTQASLIGYITRINYKIDSAFKVTYTITRSYRNNNYTYTVTNVVIENGKGKYSNITRRVGVYGSTTEQTITENRSLFIDMLNTTLTPVNTSLVTFGLTNSDVSGLTYSSNTATLALNQNQLQQFYGKDIAYNVDISKGQYHIERITDSESYLYATNIFDSLFPLMDASQSEYIYPVPDVDVLAPRFQNAPHQKPNGMYVLASSKGRTAGSVLPANISIDKMFKLNESKTDYIDFNNLKLSDIVTSGAYVDSFEDDFKKMFQLSYNEKSAILPNKDNGSLADLVLVGADPNKQLPILRGGVMNGNTITFTVPSDAFVDNFITYKVDSASLAEKAVIAKSGISLAEHTSFRSVYNSRTTNILDGDFESIITGNIIKGQSSTLTTKLTVYSEISTQISSLLNRYKTEYTIVITTINSRPTNAALDSVRFDNSIILNPSLLNNKYTVPNTTQLSPNGKVDITFRDGTTPSFSLGHEMIFLGVYYDTIPVDSTYYDVEIRGRDASRYLGFSVTLSDELKSGNYTFKFKFFDTTPEYSFEFTKAQSTANKITNIIYETYSFDELGLDNKFITRDSAFTSYIQFDIVLNGILNGINNQLITYTKVSKNVASYLNDTDYYSISYDGKEIIKLYISPFATLEGLSSSYSYSNGMREYLIEYRIYSETNINNNITHTIKERSLPNPIIYKDGNREYGDLTIRREDPYTRISIDFGFHTSVLNQSVVTKVFIDDNLYLYDDSLIYFNTSGNLYDMYITSLLEWGIKKYEFSVIREGHEYQLRTINIEKLKGTSAYLRDIYFQIDSTITLVYPDINLANSTGNIVPTTRRPLIDSDGIYYAGHDEGNQKIFRIDGKVADIDLEYYHPMFVLPIGATIQRYDPTTSLWTEDLYADYIGNGEELQVIKYRVIPEDGNMNNVVEYFITATDVLYNLTIRFNIYYRFDNGIIIDASDELSPIKNQIVIINVKNFALIHKDKNDEVIEYNVNSITTPDGDMMIYPFQDEGIKNYIDPNNPLNTQSTLFFYTSSKVNYVYTFGRNLTGAYNFSVVTPIYSGNTNALQTKGKRYDYSIYSRYQVVGEGTYPWYKPNYLLPEFDIAEEREYLGKYYYVPGSINPIIREFSIVIHERTSGVDWGLNDQK